MSELQDQNGCDVYEDGERLIHTDGTGYIAEDLAMRCPKDIFSAKYVKDQQFKVRFLVIFLASLCGYWHEILRIVIDHHK